MDQVIIKRDAMRKSGIVYLISAVISSVIFWFLRDQFVKPYGTVAVTVVAVLEFAIAVYTLLMSKGSDTLDPEGITSISPFGTQNRLWSDLKKYEIGWRYGTTKIVGIKNEKIPYIRLVFTNPHKEKHLPYREDIDQHIRRYWGMPDKDSWSADNK